MRTNFFMLAAAVAIFSVSCSKEVSKDSSDSPRLVKTTINVTSEAMTKADFNQTEERGPYSISWQSGDKVVVLQKQYPTGTYNENTMNEFTYDGSEFNGSIANPRAGAKWNAFFPSSQFSSFSSSSNTVKANLPQNQDGTKASFNTCYLMYKLNKSADSETPADQEQGTEIAGVDLSFTLRGLSSIIKINVPSALNLKTITLSAKDENDADVYVAGQITLQTAKGDAGLLNQGSGNIRKGNKTSIIADAGEGTFSGDVYIYLLPDNYTTGDDAYYYSSARSLNFQFVNSDGLTCQKSVSLDAEHPLKGGVLYDFGTLPSTLPFDFNFSLTLDPENNFKVIASSGPEGMTLSPSTAYPSDGTFTSFTVSAPGYASRTVGVCFRVWELNIDSPFWANAQAEGFESGAKATKDIEFVTDGLICTALTGSTITVKNGSGTTPCVELNKGDAANAPILSLYPQFSANASVGIKHSANGSKDRNLTIKYDGTEKGKQTVSSTSWSNYCVDVPSTSTTKSLSTHFGNGHRICKIVWMEWGENVTSSSAAPTGSAESILGTINYDI